MYKKNVLLKNKVLTDKTYISVDNYYFIKPKNFTESSNNSLNMVKLVNFEDNITLFLTVYGRFGNFCENSFDDLINSIKQDNTFAIISSNIFKLDNDSIYNVFYSKNDVFESIYYFFKNNKTFRLSFILDSNMDSTFNIVKDIFKSIF